jgi:hypothetical protein
MLLGRGASLVERAIAEGFVWKALFAAFYFQEQNPWFSADILQSQGPLLIFTKDRCVFACLQKVDANETKTTVSFPFLF